MTPRRTAFARMRGGFVGSVSGAVSVAAHAMGGGAAPTESATVLLVLACAAVGALASARVRSHDLFFLGGTLAVGQAVGHAALTVGADGHHGAQLTPAMLTAHAVAVAVAAVLISAGGRGCALAVASVRAILPAPFVQVPVEALHTPAAPAHRPRLPRWLLVGARLGTRGPPIPA